MPKSIDLKRREALKRREYDAFKHDKATQSTDEALAESAQRKRDIALQDCANLRAKIGANYV